MILRVHGVVLFQLSHQTLHHFPKHLGVVLGKVDGFKRILYQIKQLVVFAPGLNLSAEGRGLGEVGGPGEIAAMIRRRAV